MVLTLLFLSCSPSISIKAMGLIPALLLALLVSHGFSSEDDQPTVKATSGRIQFIDNGTLFVTPQEGLLRIRADLSGVYRFIQECRHHLKGKLGPNLRKSSDGKCEDNDDKPSLLSMHAASLGATGWRSGRINNWVDSNVHNVTKSHGRTRPFKDWKSKCPTLGHSDLKSTDGKMHYGMDLSVMVVERQLSRCVSRLDQQLLKFTASPFGWGTTRTSRQILLGLGLGGLALGIRNTFHLSRLEGEVDSLGKSVEGLIDESKILGKTVGSLIDYAAETRSEVFQSLGLVYRTSSLLKVAVMANAACQATTNFRMVLSDLRDHSFPHGLFTTSQLKSFFLQYSAQVKEAGLEPVLDSSTVFWTRKISGAVLQKSYNHSQAAAEFEEAQDEHQKLVLAKTEEGKGLKMEIRFGKMDTKSTTPKPLTHEDHKLENSLTPKPHHGLELVLLIPVSLKRRGEQGYKLLQLEDSLLTLARLNSTASGSPAPVITQPRSRGGLLISQGLHSAGDLLEVTGDYLNGCRVDYPKGPRTCTEEIRSPETTCLSQAYRGQPHTGACLGLYHLIDPDQPKFALKDHNPMQAFVPPDAQLLTKCQSDLDLTVQTTKPGLYTVQLNPLCSVKVGSLVFTRLQPTDVEVSLTFDQDLEEIQHLARVAEAEEEEGWAKLQELLREDNRANKNLYTLGERLREHPIVAFKRKNPGTFSSLTIGGGLLIALVAAGVGAVIYFRVQAYRRKVAEVSRTTDAQERRLNLFDEQRAYVHDGEPRARRGGNPTYEIIPLRSLEVIG